MYTMIHVKVYIETYLSESKESYLIVSVVGSSSKSKKGSKTLVGEISSSNKSLKNVNELSSLHSEHHGDKDNSRHSGEYSIKVLCIKVLSDLLSGHGLLGKNSTGSRRNIGKHSRSKSEEGEGKLLHGSNSNSSDNGEKSEVYGKREDLSEEKCVKSAGDNGLGSLYNVSKRNSSCSKSDDSSNVDTSMAKRNGEESLHIRETKLGCLTKSENPHGYEVSDSGSHLEGSNGPGQRHSIQCLLVVDIVPDVEKVPQGEVNSSLEGLSQGSRFGFSSRSSSYFLCSTLCRKSHTGRLLEVAIKG
jgi:hypothetical protein